MAYDPSGHAASYVHAGVFVVFADHISTYELVRIIPGTRFVCMLLPRCCSFQPLDSVRDCGGPEGECDRGRARDVDAREKR